MPATAKALQNKPHLISGLGIYFQAYNDLKTEATGQSGIIPWSSIIKWAEFTEIKDKDEIKRLMRYIRAMEVAERNLRESKRKK